MRRRRRKIRRMYRRFNRNRMITRFLMMVIHLSSPVFSFSRAPAMHVMMCGGIGMTSPQLSNLKVCRTTT